MNYLHIDYSTSSSRDTNSSLQTSCRDLKELKEAIDYYLIDKDLIKEIRIKKEGYKEFRKITDDEYKMIFC